VLRGPTPLGLGDPGEAILGVDPVPLLIRDVGAVVGRPDRAVRLHLVEGSVGGELFVEDLHRHFGLDRRRCGDLGGLLDEVDAARGGLDGGGGLVAGGGSASDDEEERRSRGEEAHDHQRTD
jgi:hypothetical protein